MLPIFYDFVLFRDSCILKLFICRGPEKPRPRLTGYLWLLPALLTPPPMAELPFPPQASHSYITLPFWLLALLVLLLVPNSPSPLPLSFLPSSPLSHLSHGLICLLVKFSLDSSQCLLLKFSLTSTINPSQPPRNGQYSFFSLLLPSLPNTDTTMDLWKNNS